MSEVKEYIATQLSPMSDPPFYAGLPVNIVVLASDYAALQAKADALKASNEAMAKALEYMADEAHWVDPDALLRRPGGAGRQGIYSWSGEVKGWAFSKTALGKTPMAIDAHRAKDAGEKPL